MAEKKPLGPSGDGTRGVLAHPTVGDQLRAEKAARDRQNAMGWEPVKVAKKPARAPKAAPPKGRVNDRTRALSPAQRATLAQRLKARLGKGRKA